MSGNTMNAMALGARTASTLAVAVAMYGAAFGVLARQAGLDLVEASAMSSIIFAGASQFVALDMWAPDLPVGAMILAVLVVNLRHVLMGASIAPWMNTLSPVSRFGTLYFMVDENWAMTVASDIKDEDKPAFLLGSGLFLFVCWNLSTLAGAALVPSMDDPARYGIDFLFCAAFLALLAGSWRGKRDVPVWAASAAAAVAAYWLLPGKWYILAGGIAGGLAGAWNETDQSGEAAQTVEEA